MKFYNWLNESSRSKKYKEEEIIEILKENCSEAIDRYQRDLGIWRASNTSGPYLLTNPTGNRKSKFAVGNFYTLILNNHPMWSSFPKREIICSSGSDRSIVHGSNFVYNVFPFDGAKIGICSDDDVWVSFPELERYDFEILNEFNGFIEKVMYDYKVGKELKAEKFFKDLKNTTLEDILYFINFEADEERENLDYYRNIIIKMKKDFKADTTMYEVITKLFDPKKNMFRLQKISDYNVRGDYEVWTDSKCVLIDISLTEDILYNKMG